MSEAKLRLQHLVIEMMMNVYQILLANTRPNYVYMLSNFGRYLSQERHIHMNIMYYSNNTFSGVLRGFTSSHVEEPVSSYYTCVS